LHLRSTTPQSCSVCLSRASARAPVRLRVRIVVIQTRKRERERLLFLVPLYFSFLLQAILVWKSLALTILKSSLHSPIQRRKAAPFLAVARAFENTNPYQETSLGAFTASFVRRSMIRGIPRRGLGGQALLPLPPYPQPPLILTISGLPIIPSEIPPFLTFRTLALRHWRTFLICGRLSTSLGKQPPAINSYRCQCDGTRTGKVVSPRGSFGNSRKRGDLDEGAAYAVCTAWDIMLVTSSRV
jgi:hypothetical protein